MLEYLKNNPNALVITDNHLACDIPNEYKIILVHHGVGTKHTLKENQLGTSTGKIIVVRDKKKCYIIEIH